MRTRGVLLVVWVGLAAWTCSKPPPPPAANGTGGAERRVPHPSPDATLFVQGILDPEGKELLRFGPIRRSPGVAKARPAAASGRYAVRVELADGGVVVAPFDGLVAADPGGTRHGFFEVVVPVGGEVRRVRVVEVEGGSTLGAVDGAAIEDR